MTPILIVELNGHSLKQEVIDLQSGLLDALNFYAPIMVFDTVITEALEHLDAPTFTVDQMRHLRELVPELRVVGHYLTAEDAAILDRS